MNALPEQTAQTDVVPGLRREWMILLRRRQVIGLLVVLGLLGAAGFNYSALPLYDGTAIISIGESAPGQPLARLNGDVARLDAVIDKEFVRLRSQELAAKVVDALGPEGSAELARGPIGPWYTRLRFTRRPQVASDGQMKRGDAVAALRSRVRLNWRSPSTWVDVRVTGFEPEGAADIANKLVALYVDEMAQANQKTLEESRSAFESRMASKEKQLDEQLSELQRTGGTDFAARRAVLERQIKGFQEALVAAQTARIGRAATSKEATQIAGGGLLSNDPRVQAAQDRVNEFEDKERSLLATLGSLHPEVIAVQEQLRASRERLAATVAGVEKAAQSSYELAVREEARIESSLSRAQMELSQLERTSFSSTMDQKRADASRASMDVILRQQETQLPIIIEAEIIQTANPVRTPTFPQKSENFGYALAGALALGIFLAWGLDRFDDTVQTPDDIKDTLGLPFLGVIPLVDTIEESIETAIQDSKTGFADGLRVIRTSLLFAKEEPRLQVLVFTSAAPGDGKSTVASGVALLLQEAQKRVLLIDGDLRRPSIHEAFGIETTPGLSEQLAREGAPVLEPIPRPGTPGLDILPAGVPLTVSAALLGSENMRTLIRLARERYDWVIIDSPPSLGLPDAAVLANLADAVVVVCGADKTPRQALKSVADQLRSIGVRLLGVALNRVNLERHSYYYGRYYSAYYGQDERAAKSGKKRKKKA